MSLPSIASGGRVAQARLERDKAAEPAQPPAAQAEADEGATSTLTQRLVQASDEMSAALTQFRGRRSFGLQADGLTDNFERVLEDDLQPKVQQLLGRVLAQMPVTALLQLARKLFADDSDLVWVLRELLRRPALDKASRQRLDNVLQTVLAQACPRRLQAGINAALKARLFGSALAVRAALLRETYRDFLESDDGPLSCYQDWIALYGASKRTEVLAFIEAALLTDIGAQDPSCSRLEFGQLLTRLNELKQLRSAEALFIAGVLGDPMIGRHNAHESDWLVFLLGLLGCPQELEALLAGVLGETVHLSPPAERSALVQAVRRFSLQLPLPLFADGPAALGLAQQFSRLADRAWGDEGLALRCSGDEA